MSWLRKPVGRVVIQMELPKIVGKDRPRFTRSGGVYTTGKTSKAEEAIESRFVRAAGGKWKTFDGPVSVSVETSRQLSRSNPKCWAGKTDTMKPDADNILKLVLDALNGTAYKDDSQVFRADVRKADRTPFGTGNQIEITVRYYTDAYSKEKK